MTVAEVLSKAADAIEERGWNQGDYVNDSGGVCVVGALSVALGERPFSGNAAGEAFFDARRALSNHLGEYAVDWNDDPERTQEEVVAALRAAAERYGQREDAAVPAG